MLAVQSCAHFGDVGIAGVSERICGIQLLYFRRVAAIQVRGANAERPFAKKPSPGGDPIRAQKLLQDEWF